MEDRLHSYQSSSCNTTSKLRKIHEHANSMAKFQSLSKHRAIWHEEWIYLGRMQKKMEAEIEELNFIETFYRPESTEDFNDFHKLLRDICEVRSLDMTTHLATGELSGLLNSIAKAKESFEQSIIEKELICSQLEAELKTVSGLDLFIAQSDDVQSNFLSICNSLVEVLDSLEDEVDFKQKTLEQFNSLKFTLIQKLQITSHEIQEISRVVKRLSPSDRAHLWKLCEEYRRHTSFDITSLLCERIKIEKPDWKYLDKLKNTVKTIMRLRLLYSHIVSDYHECDKAIRNFTSSKVEEFENSRAQAAHRKTLKDCRDRLAEIQLKKSDLLESWRRLKIHELEIAQEIERKRQYDISLERQEKAQREKSRRKKLKESLEMSMSLRRQAEQAALKQLEAKRIETLHSLQLQKEHNRYRIQERQKIVDKKKEEVLLKERREQERMQLLQQALQRLRESVAVVVKRDSARVLSVTESLCHRVKDCVPKKLFPVHSYTDDNIFRDMRSKVGLALHEAGLFQSAYTRQLLPKLPPATKPRPDLYTSAA